MNGLLSTRNIIFQNKSLYQYLTYLSQQFLLNLIQLCPWVPCDQSQVMCYQHGSKHSSTSEQQGEVAVHTEAEGQQYYCRAELRQSWRLEIVLEILT